jgi:hypothetical protein
LVWSVQEYTSAQPGDAEIVVMSSVDTEFEGRDCTVVTWTAPRDQGRDATLARGSGDAAKEIPAQH